jgi:hypothetical protein
VSWTGGRRLPRPHRVTVLWVGLLAIGEQLLTVTGNVEVSSIDRIPATLRVYNLEVEEVHSFLASSWRVLVHNAADCHGNSKTSPKEQHRYEIVDNKNNGDVVKTGISGQDLNKNGTSPRANSQVNQWNREAGEERYSPNVKEVKIPGRAAGLENEQAATNSLSADGNSLRLQQKPTPK